MTLSNITAGARRRPVLGLAAASVLTLAGLALPAPSQATTAAAAVADCATTFPEGDVVKDQEVRGLTVSEGTTPEEFTGSVIGVLKDGIAPGTDMILMDLHSSAIDKAGIWEGMSGSPVYDKASGEIIGAVSYSLSYGNTTVAGVTPFAAMQRYRPAASPTRVPIRSQAMAQKVASAAGVTDVQAADGMTRLPIPVSVTGISADRLAQVHQDRKPYLRRASATGRMGVAKASSAPGSESMMAGGNIAAAMVYGDVVEGGVGTITSICNGGFVAFGHAMNSNGTTTLAALASDAVLIVTDPLNSSYKQVNLGSVTGVVSQDRTTGISGTLGSGPATMKATATSSYGAASRTGTSYSASADFDADAAALEALTNSDSVLDAWYVKGGALSTYTVKGTDHGKPFTLSYGNRYAAPDDISTAAAYPIGDLVYALSQVDGVRLTGVNTTSAFNNVSATRRLSTVEQKKGTKWLKVTANKPISVKAGGRAVLRFTLTGGGTAPVTQRVTIDVPKRMKNTSGYLDVTGGGDTYTDLIDVTSVAQARKVIGQSLRNDTVGLDLSVRGHGQKLSRSIKLSPGSRVVTGSKEIPFVVTKVKK